MIIVAANTSELAILDNDTINKADKVLITGVGGQNAVKLLARYGEPWNMDILNVGYAGSNKLEIGTKVQISTAKTHHLGVDFREDGVELDRLEDDLPSVPCYTASDFVTKTKVKEAAVFDMELAYLAALGFRHLYAIKQVSDKLNIKQYERNIS